MCDKGISMTKFFGTQITLEWFFTSVTSFMSFQVILSIGAVTAIFALCQQNSHLIPFVLDSFLWIFICSFKSPSLRYNLKQEGHCCLFSLSSVWTKAIWVVRLVFVEQLFSQILQHKSWSKTEVFSIWYDAMCKGVLFLLLKRFGHWVQLKLSVFWWIFLMCTLKRFEFLKFFTQTEHSTQTSLMYGSFGLENLKSLDKDYYNFFLILCIFLWACKYFLRMKPFSHKSHLNSSLSAWTTMWELRYSSSAKSLFAYLTFKLLLL